MKRTAILLVLAAGMLAACAQSADRGAAPPSPADPSGGDAATSSDLVRPVGGDLRMGEPWHLVGTSLSSIEMPPGLTITFEEDTVGGAGPVNQWFAEYTATADGHLTMSALGSTLIGSDDEQLTTAESAYFELLGMVDGYTAVDGGELYLFDDQANTLVFSVDPPVEDPTAISEATRTLAEHVVGMTESEAKAAVEPADHTFRVGARDGERFALTADYNITRITVTVEADRVTEATIG